MKATQRFGLAEWLVIAIPLAVLLLVLLSSCQKEKIETSPEDVGRTYVRIQEVDNDGAVQYSTITMVNVKN